MANIIKRAIRIFNGREWDKYYPETSADQVVYTKPDGTASNVQTELAEQNSAMKIDLGTTETPTHELYEGKRIYTKYIDCADLPNSGDKIYQLNIPGTFFWVDWGNSYIYSDAESFRGTIYPLNYANPKTGKGITYALDRYGKNIVFTTNENWQGYNAFIVVKYYY